ncbi:MAG: hypothetical protein PHE53_01160 [Thermoguttaceae bacterium]|nr:hypothetical protein [Thermoguttaceae bacterium]
MNIRRVGYWIYDACFRGGAVRKNLADIERILNGGEPLQSVVDGYRKSIFQYAMRQVPFYQSTRSQRFEELPVINKMIIKSQPDQFMSPEYADQKLHKMSTSGSTGTPFSVYQEMNKRYRVLAEILAFHPEGFKVRDHLVFIRGLTSATRKPAWKLWGMNMTLLDAADLSDARLDSLREDFQHYREKTMLFGYASVYERLGKYMLAKGDESKSFPHICAVITASESLSPAARDALQRVFKAPVLSRYSNQEMGILGQQLDHEDFFVLNTASYYFEVFDLERDVPVADGTQGRIVITDLFNHAMPLLRYDTGDIGTLETKIIQGKPRRVLTTLEGRRVDLICNTRGDFMSPHTITNYLWEFPEIVQYQLIQKAQKNYEVHLNVKSKFLQEGRLRAVLKQCLGEDAEIQISYVNEIPVMASGKRKVYVNEWKKSA